MIAYTADFTQPVQGCNNKLGLKLPGTVTIHVHKPRGRYWRAMWGDPASTTKARPFEGDGIGEIIGLTTADVFYQVRRQFETQTRDWKLREDLLNPAEPSELALMTNKRGPELVK